MSKFYTFTSIKKSIKINSSGAEGHCAYIMSDIMLCSHYLTKWKMTARELKSFVLLQKIIIDYLIILGFSFTNWLKSNDLC